VHSQEEQVLVPAGAAADRPAVLFFRPLLRKLVLNDQIYFCKFQIACLQLILEEPSMILVMVFV
jgi:hypothetical protein